MRPSPDIVSKGAPFCDDSGVSIPRKSILCEVSTKPSEFSSLTKIVRVCARDSGIRIRIGKAVSPVPDAPQSAIMLHLPVELAAAQHPVWCLACRLACFCPQTRVSVLVRGEGAFSAPAQTRASRVRSA